MALDAWGRDRGRRAGHACDRRHRKVDVEATSRERPDRSARDIPRRPRWHDRLVVPGVSPHREDRRGAQTGPWSSARSGVWAQALPADASARAFDRRCADPAKALGFGRCRGRRERIPHWSRPVPCQCSHRQHRSRRPRLRWHDVHEGRSVRWNSRGHRGRMRATPQSGRAPWHRHRPGKVSAPRASAGTGLDVLAPRARRLLQRHRHRRARRRLVAEHCSTEERSWQSSSICSTPSPSTQRGGTCT